MEMTNKERYHQFCLNNSVYVPVFSRDWWMDAVCGPDQWDVYLVGDGMDIRAAFVYYLCEDQEGVCIKRAPITQNNGIIFKYPENQGVVAKQHYEEKIVDEICDFIESLDLKRYEQQFHYSYTNWLPFFWRYYKETTRYTYVLEDTDNYESLLSNYASKTKNGLRKAQKYLHVEECTDIEEFYSVNKMSFDRQCLKPPYTIDILNRLYSSCLKNDAGLMLKAVDDEGKIHSVAMLVWDNESVYYVLNGTNPELKMFQGNLLLIDYGIQFAHEKRLKFDFEGSVVKNINHVFREFGGIPKPYFRIYKDFK